MNTKILTTHVGSLPRSKALSELLFAKDKGDSFSENEFEYKGFRVNSTQAVIQIK